MYVVPRIGQSWLQGATFTLRCRRASEFEKKGVKETFNFKITVDKCGMALQQQQREQRKQQPSPMTCLNTSSVCVL